LDIPPFLGASGHVRIWHISVGKHCWRSCRRKVFKTTDRTLGARLTGSNGFQKREKFTLRVFLLKKISLVSLVVGVLCAAEVIAGIAGWEILVFQSIQCQIGRQSAAATPI